MIAWGSLGLVAVVSLVAAVAVTVLVSFALVGLAARASTVGGPEDGAPTSRMSPATGTAVAAVCLTATALIVLYGLGIIVGLL